MTQWFRVISAVFAVLYIRKQNILVVITCCTFKNNNIYEVITISWHASLFMYVYFMLHMIYHRDILPYGMSIAFPTVVQMGKHLLVCESSVWIMTPWAECLFAVPQKNANLKKAKWRTACFSPRVFEGWRAATIHTCWEWRTDQESNMCCGWKIYLEGACVLNRIRKLRERKQKQTGIYISLKLWTGMHNTAPCRTCYFNQGSRFTHLSHYFWLCLFVLYVSVLLCTDS